MSHLETVPLSPQNVPPTRVATMPRRTRRRRSRSRSPRWLPSLGWMLSATCSSPTPDLPAIAYHLSCKGDRHFCTRSNVQKCLSPLHGPLCAPATGYTVTENATKEDP